jgi:hypothetical protein
MKMWIFVMPAWMAGIQVREDSSGNIHVSLGSNIPCWNDAIEGPCLKLTDARAPRIFERDSLPVSGEHASYRLH